MNTPSYLSLQKYHPDLHRYSSRAHRRHRLSRYSALRRVFLQSTLIRPGEVDGRSIPSFVTSASAIGQWIRYWRDWQVVGNEHATFERPCVVSSRFSGLLLEGVATDGARQFSFRGGLGSVLDLTSARRSYRRWGSAFSRNLLEANNRENHAILGSTNCVNSTDDSNSLKDHSQLLDRIFL